ncbi:uncharacterized protein CLUP02_00984 [Colletotrichum lupini]|uniref:Uncharacterized protein n=1 Tax=Colletotrichum lupini TaxID=145971 RepID=A0A9Q8SCD8_9PEZI|nr:uncharacterized protein CLUP02_00984 [Colletotrichum lupini]UQC74336.1 hypothetical protein CLUP02_00984 [Colletotrichum lupini]
MELNSGNKVAKFSLVRYLGWAPVESGLAGATIYDLAPHILPYCEPEEHASTELLNVAAQATYLHPGCMRPSHSPRICGEMLRYRGGRPLKLGPHWEWLRAADRGNPGHQHHTMELDSTVYGGLKHLYGIKEESDSMKDYP